MAQWSKEHVVNSHIQYHISIFLQGLKETVHPYTFVSRNGFQEMLEVDGAYQKVLPILPKITFSIRAALVIKICLIYLRHRCCIFHIFDHCWQSIGSLYMLNCTHCPVFWSAECNLRCFCFFLSKVIFREAFIYLSCSCSLSLSKKVKMYCYIKRHLYVCVQILSLYSYSHLW